MLSIAISDSNHSILCIFLTGNCSPLSEYGVQRQCTMCKLPEDDQQALLKGSVLDALYFYVPGVFYIVK